ncbi:MAG: hypothetical protein KDA46_01965, partial [Parvularculaceae bacterium]|nr:hypothetical protein [Parvularculaceae bacterium]
MPVNPAVAPLAMVLAVASIVELESAATPLGSIPSCLINERCISTTRTLSMTCSRSRIDIMEMTFCGSPMNR